MPGGRHYEAGEWWDMTVQTLLAGDALHWRTYERVVEGE